MAILETVPVSIDSDPGVLRTVARAHTVLSIWDRTPPDALATLASVEVDDVLERLPVAGAEAAAQCALSAAGYPAAAATALAGDIARLSGFFAPIAGTEHLLMRLEVVETDACRRFHADYVRYRLICTYAGPGTQWRPASAAAPVRQVPAGAVAIFKGRRLLDDPPVLHRSPPVAASGERRLVLVLDPAD